MKLKYFYKQILFKKDFLMFKSQTYYLLFTKYHIIEKRIKIKINVKNKNLNWYMVYVYILIKIY